MPYLPYVPTWSTCTRANLSINVPTCQRCANYSTWRTNVPTACQFLKLACQRAKYGASFLFWRTNVTKGVLDFQIVLLRNAKGVSKLYYYIKNYTVYLISQLCIYVYVSYIKIVLYYISILHVIIKKNVRNFCFFETFLFFSSK